MDETTYSDPDVAHFISDHFVAIRVDSDHRPDINARYNVGGWPTTAFLTGHGGLVGAATYLPPDQFLAMLMEMQRAYQERKPDLYNKAAGLLHQRREQVDRVAAGGEVDASLVDQIARRIAGAYDPLYGGLGTEPKFPNAPVLQLLVHLLRATGEDFYRVILEKTLEHMADGELFDREEGGFFRHCAKRDWSQAQHEKVLEDNLALARVYLESYLLSPREKYRQVASQTIDYLLGQLSDDQVSCFHGSQGAHSSYFGLPLTSRRDHPNPPVDPSCYANSNALAVSLLMDAAWMLRRPDLAELAIVILEKVDSLAQSGRLCHVMTSDNPSPSEDAGESPEARPSFLTDWAYLLNALMDAHTYTSRPGYLERAKDVASELVERFADARNGGFFDIQEDKGALGLLRIREKPLPDNAATVLGLLKLYHATRNDDYRHLAQATLSAYTEAHGSYGEFAASYAVAVYRFLHPPIEITVEGRLEDTATHDLLTAASRVRYPHIIVKPLPVHGNPSAARAYICLDTLCLPPVSDPNTLAGAVENMLSPQVSPFENILGRFSG